MGVFDSVYVRCPQCGDLVEFQSKAGDCTLASYNQTEVPANIAADINGDVQSCTNCGHLVRVHSPVPSLVTVYAT